MISCISNMLFYKGFSDSHSYRKCYDLVLTLWHYSIEAYLQIGKRLNHTHIAEWKKIRYLVCRFQVLADWTLSRTLPLFGLMCHLMDTRRFLTTAHIRRGKYIKHSLISGKWMDWRANSTKPFFVCSSTQQGILLSLFLILVSTFVICLLVANFVCST